MSPAAAHGAHSEPRQGGCDADALPAAEERWVGEILAGRYRIVRLLGQGGMGSVYEAQHLDIGRRFAIKFPRIEPTRRDEMIARFRREARAAGSLEHENIAAVIDFGVHPDPDDHPFLVMEYLEGADMARLLQREGALPAPRAADLVRQACLALEAAHGRGVIHRDLKPQNLFICRRPDGTDLVKVLDFGIAKLTQTGSTGALTATGATLGTPFYLPPEQARGDKELDHRADIYALGVILYEALAGQVPHPGESHNAIIYHILNKQPEPLAVLRVGLPAGLAEIVEHAMASEPDERISTAAGLGRELGRFARPATAERTAATEALAVGSRTAEACDATAFRLQQVSVEDGVAEAAAQLDEGQTGDGEPGASGPASVRGADRSKLWLGVAATVVAAALIGWVVSSGRQSPTEPSSADPVLDRSAGVAARPQPCATPPHLRPQQAHAGPSDRGAAAELAHDQEGVSSGHVRPAVDGHTAAPLANESTEASIPASVVAGPGSATSEPGQATNARSQPQPASAHEATPGASSKASAAPPGPVFERNNPYD